MTDVSQEEHMILWQAVRIVSAHRRENESTIERHFYRQLLTRLMVLLGAISDLAILREPQPGDDQLLFRSLDFIAESWTPHEGGGL